MKDKTLKQAFPMVLIIFSAALATLPLTASAEDEPWQIRFAVVSMNPSGSSVIVHETGERFSYETSNGVGAAIDLEYRASRRLGIDFGIITSSPGIKVTVDAQPLSVSASGDITITPIYAALNFHLTPDSRFDLYIGPMLAWVLYNRIELVAGPGISEELSSQNSLGIGAVLGLDIGLGSGRWSLNGAIRYLDTTLKASSADGGVGETDIDPTIFSFGFGYRF